MGFAVRMSRLEAHRPTIRIIVRTSRVCLLLQGISAVAGTAILQVIPSAASIPLTGDSSLAAGICNLLIGAVLILKSRHPKSRIQSALTVLVGAFLGSCWISLLLFSAGLAPNPAILQIDILPLAITTAICVVLSSATRIPGILKVLSDGGPEAEAARILFPMAFVIPLALAFLRHRAESQGLLQRDLGLLLHVLFSVGSMTLMIVWNANRISSARRILASTKAAIEEVEAQYRDVLAVCLDPVWIFSPEGGLLFQNDAADQYSATEGRVKRISSGPECVLGTAQQGALLSAALFGRKVAELRLYDRVSGNPRVLDVKFLRALVSDRGEPRAVIVVARAIPSAL